MLADELLRIKGGDLDRRSDGGVSAFVSRVAQAQRFVLGSEVCAAAYQVTYNKPSSIVKGLSLARPSFPLMWVEWCPSDMGFENDRGQEKAALFGTLIECRNEQQTLFDCTFAWAHRVDGRISPKAKTFITVSAVGLAFDLENHAVSDLPGFNAGTVALRSSYYATERVAVEKLFTHAAPQRTMYMRAFLNNLATKNDQSFSNLFSTQYSTAMNINGCMIAVLSLLNSRNIVRIAPADTKKQNRIRKICGKRELLSYSEVTIDLSRGDTARASALRLSPAEIRQHIVRGHFKVRKGGIYWWRPFLRGSAEAGKIIRSRYRVAGQPAGDVSGAVA